MRCYKALTLKREITLRYDSGVLRALDSQDLRARLCGCENGRLRFVFWDAQAGHAGTASCPLGQAWSGGGSPCLHAELPTSGAPAAGFAHGLHAGRHSLPLPGAAALRPAKGTGGHRAVQGSGTPSSWPSGREAPRPAGTRRIGERAVGPETLPTARCVNRPEEGARSPACPPGQARFRGAQSRGLGGAAPLGDPRASAAPQGLGLIPRSPCAALEESGRSYKRNLPPPGGDDFLAPSPTSRDACGLSAPTPLLGRTAGQLGQLPPPP